MKQLYVLLLAPFLLGSTQKACLQDHGSVGVPENISSKLTGTYSQINPQTFKFWGIQLNDDSTYQASAISVSERRSSRGSFYFENGVITLEPNNTDRAKDAVFAAWAIESVNWVDGELTISTMGQDVVLQKTHGHLYSLYNKDTKVLAKSGVFKMPLSFDRGLLYSYNLEGELSQVQAVEGGNFVGDTLLGVH